MIRIPVMYRSGEGTAFDHACDVDKDGAHGNEIVG
jgi:hypothetical protein